MTIARNSKTNFSSAVIGMHWLTVLLLAAIYACMELRGWAPRGSVLRADMKSLHFSLGLCILLLVALRLVLRWIAGTTPVIVPAMSSWQERTARLGHVVLYAFLIAMPVLGWLALSAAGTPILLFGMALPALVAPSEALAAQIKDVHEAMATVGYFLVGLHAAAALAHHYVRRDNTLVRMLPSWRARKASR